MDNPWYIRASNYWTFDDIVYNTVEDLMGDRAGNAFGIVRNVQGIINDGIELSEIFTRVDFGNFTNSCLSIPDQCKTGFTLAFWIKFNSNQNEKYILQISKGITTSVGSSIYIDKGFIGAAVNSYNTIRNVEVSWPDDVWTHVSLVWNKTANDLALYLDCSEVSYARKSIRRAGLDPYPPPQGKLILGADYGFLKNGRFAIDELGYWTFPLPRKMLCYIFRARRGRMILQIIKYVDSIFSRCQGWIGSHI